MSVAAAPQKRHPWLDRFENDPEGELQALLGGYARVEPYTRLEPSTLLTRLFDGLPDGDPLIVLLDQTAQAFVAARRHDRPAEWQAYGLDRYVGELRELFMAVRDLALPGCIRAWGAEFSALSLWLEPLRIGDHGDARKAFWHLLAHHPDLSGVPLPVLKQHWTKLCALVGAGQLSDNYLDVALDGLSALPDALALANSPLLTGFARWIEPLSAPDADSMVAPTWLALISAYPLSDADWAQRAATLFNDPTFRRCCGAANWAKVLGLDLVATASRNAASALEPPEGWKSATDALIKSFRHLGLTADWRAQLDAFVARSEAFVNRTGDSRYHRRNMNRLGTTVLATSPDTTLRLVHSALTFDASDAHNHGLWAQALVRQGRDDEAQQVYWEGIRLAPDNVHLRSQLAELLLRMGRAHEAEALLRETIHTFPTNAVARNALAKLLAENGKSDAAEALLRQTIHTFPTNEVAPTALAKLLAENGKSDAAEAELRQTIHAFPNDAVAPTALAKLLAENGKSDTAEALLRQTIHTFPTNAVAPNALAKLLAENGKIDAAEALLRLTIHTFPTNAVTRNALAKLLAENGKIDAAEAELRQTIHAFPNDEVARNALAKLLAENGKIDAAEAELRQTIHAFPNDAVARNALAKLLAENGKIDAAEELYQQTRARFQNDPVCRLDLGFLLLKNPQRDPGQQTVSALLQELRALNHTGANTLHFHLQRFQQGPAFALVGDDEQSPQPEREQSPNTASERVLASPPLMIGAAACRAAFLLGPALVDPQLVLVSNDNRRDLQDEAREMVRSLLKQAPNHPLLLLLARRYLEAGNTDGTAAFDADIFAMAPASPAMAIFARRWGHMPAGSGWVAHRWPAFTPLAEFATFLADPEAGTAAVARWLGSQPHHEHLAVARLRGELRRLTGIERGPVPAKVLRALHHTMLQTPASTHTPNPLDALLDICLMATLETLPDQRLFELHAA
jgi:Flp pilus assembly protein TadD